MAVDDYESVARVAQEIIESGFEEQHENMQMETPDRVPMNNEVRNLLLKPQ
jgi:hypothetical protein